MERKSEELKYAINIISFVLLLINKRCVCGLFILLRKAHFIQEEIC